MPLCQTCGVNMTASERVFNHQGVAGNWHLVCEYAEHLRDIGSPAAGDTGWRVTNLSYIARLIAKQNNASAPAALTATITAGGAMTAGVYLYKYTWVNANGGESLPSPSATDTAATTNLASNLTVISVGPAGTVSRRVYRTQSGGATYTLLTTIADNTTTTFSDTASDASIVSNKAIPSVSTFAGDFP